MKSYQILSVMSKGFFPLIWLVEFSLIGVVCEPSLVVGYGALLDNLVSDVLDVFEAFTDLALKLSSGPVEIPHIVFRKLTCVSFDFTFNFLGTA